MDKTRTNLLLKDSLQQDITNINKIGKQFIKKINKINWIMKLFLKNIENEIKGKNV